DRGLARRVAGGERVGATATLHPGNGDRPAGAQRRNFAADEIEVAHAIEIAVIGDAGRAIAGAELGAKVELDLSAAIGRLAGECAAGSPLIHGERPRHLRPERTDVGCVARQLARGPWCDERDGDRACELSARLAPPTRGRARLRV